MSTNRYAILNSSTQDRPVDKIEHPCYSGDMDSLEKLALVSADSQFEQAGEIPYRARAAAVQTQACGQSPVQWRRQVGGVSDWVHVPGKSRPIPIYQTSAGGRRVPLLKAMLTTACERDCLYCPFRAGRRSRRVTFKPDEMAETFFAVHQSGRVEGLFLSSGVFAGGVNTQDKLLDTAEILRARLGYRNYLHLKLMPGAEQAQVLRAMQLADRVSINLEAPNASRLARLAPRKRYLEELLPPLQWAAEIRRDLPSRLGWRGRWASSTTQFVVGAAGEDDVEILSTVTNLFNQLGVRRTYFEAFSPVPDTPLDSQPAEDPLRQQRLYEASYLLRDYGFEFEDLPFNAQGRLPLDRDPKRAVADRTLVHAPIEVNLADREQLLRVPGLGPKGVGAVLRARRERRLTDVSQLQRLGILAERAAPYITLAGRRPAVQARLF
jgi:predicted DNA-binding helix-hairpin-helix protein